MQVAGAWFLTFIIFIAMLGVGALVDVHSQRRGGGTLRSQLKKGAAMLLTLVGGLAVLGLIHHLVGLL